MIEVFSLITLNKRWLRDSQTAIKNGRSNDTINLTKGEERLTGACMGTLLLSG